ncbi:IS1341-type transposase [Halodesulfurarchaeum formicicum]|uniref:IS1341-type transposase n=1 Tax=Halodesulfurarchaeum formicicum TaxID=1873524 RepID=A0A1J1ADY1_9EURY|nr:RNA-guided endonuclease TnpB family protein [Halodesulfurarchaeum formicicum]AOW80446.1 IS1341-type transposase [Halodesulfurarchaeum formicicum]APE94923.1 transposase, IS605 OrfB family [Halodesulfurarchaeum formicicum]APE95785.1 IS1341-type transposase [Halodesulfurarchaeum formicicum]
MSNQVVTRTVKASIQNQPQVRDDLDSHAYAASKLWNVGRWTVQRVWDAIGYIPEATELTSYLKGHARYDDLHSQSSQKVLQELSDAFHSWYEQDNPDHNPPGYRKRGDAHPRSTVTWKNNGFKLDTDNNRVRLSKGANMKPSRYAADYILCEYEEQADYSLDDIDRVQTVRAVWTGEKWELHFVSKLPMETAESGGEKTAGIDLGISNTAAVSVGDETLLYPGNALKEDAHYFRQIEYDTEGEDGPSQTAEWARQKKARRQEHFLHAVSKDIVQECDERNVGTIAVGHPKNIRQDGDWGRHGNKRLHDWAFETLIQQIEYKAEERGIEAERVDEGSLKTSKTCCECGMVSDSNRVERGLYVCEACGLVANSDLNAAENMRATVTPNPSQDRSNGCLAQPSVRLFDKQTGQIAPQEQVVP